jgi:hypothetical protein
MRRPHTLKVSDKVTAGQHQVPHQVENTVPDKLVAVTQAARGENSFAMDDDGISEVYAQAQRIRQKEGEKFGLQPVE